MSSVQQVATVKMRNGALFCKIGDISEPTFSLLFTRGLSLFSQGHENPCLD
jgi:hypothetical protein